jgi:hypothetical protein
MAFFTSFRVVREILCFDGRECRGGAAADRGGGEMEYILRFSVASQRQKTAGDRGRDGTVLWEIELLSQRQGPLGEAIAVRRISPECREQICARFFPSY